MKMNADRLATTRADIPGLLLPGACLILLLAVGLTGAAQAAQIHKWVDRNGKTHFGDRPPADGTPSQEVRIRDIPESDLQIPSNQERRARQDYLLRSFDEERTKKKQTRAREKEERRQLVEKCRRARDNLQKLKRSSYLYESDAAGNRIIRSQEVREQVIDNLEQAVSKNCR